MSYRTDPIVRPLADRHYNRQHVGAPNFVPPGRCLVLRTEPVPCTVYWVSSWPYAEYVRHAWAGAWMCSAFRREAGELSSELIRQAVAATRWYWGDPPPLGMVTFVDPSVVPGFIQRTKEGPVMEWGYSYQKAGFKYCGWTQGGLFALRLAPEDAPAAECPVNGQGSLLTEVERGRGERQAYDANVPALLV